MNHGTHNHFETATFLATEGPGRSILRHAARQAIFAQGGPADSVFYLQNGPGKTHRRFQERKGSNGHAACRRGLLWRRVHGGIGSAANRPRRRRSPSAWCSRSRETGCFDILHEEHASPTFSCSSFSTRGIRTQADLVDQLFNSSERRLARTLLLMAEFGKAGEPEPLIPHVTQETLAEMIGTTRSRVSFFMNRFRKLGYIEYNGRIRVIPRCSTWFCTIRCLRRMHRGRYCSIPGLRRRREAKRAKQV